MFHNCCTDSSRVDRCDKGLGNACKQVGEASLPESYNVIRRITFLAERGKT